MMYSRLSAWFLSGVFLVPATILSAGFGRESNQAPRANVGLARSVVVGEIEALDASRSTDPDGNWLCFHWFLQTPTGSGAVLSDARALRPQFSIDLLGDYTAELIFVPAVGCDYLVELTVSDSQSRSKAARFRLFDAGDNEIYDSSVVSLTNGELSLDMSPDTSSVRRARFEGVTRASMEPCLSEFEAIGADLQVFCFELASMT